MIITDGPAMRTADLLCIPCSLKDRPYFTERIPAGSAASRSSCRMARPSPSSATQIIPGEQMLSRVILRERNIAIKRNLKRQVERGSPSQGVRYESNW